MKETIRVSIFGKPLSAYHSLGVILYVAATAFSRDASGLDGGAWLRGAGNSDWALGQMLNLEIQLRDWDNNCRPAYHSPPYQMIARRFLQLGGEVHALQDRADIHAVADSASMPNLNLDRVPSTVP